MTFGPADTRYVRLRALYFCFHEQNIKCPRLGHRLLYSEIFLCLESLHRALCCLDDGYALNTSLVEETCRSDTAAIKANARFKAPASCFTNCKYAQSEIAVSDITSFILQFSVHNCDFQQLSRNLELSRKESVNFESSMQSSDNSTLPFCKAKNDGISI